MEESCKPLLLALGNPLLDMTLVLKDTTLHKKFNLPKDGQLEVSLDQHQIFDIVNNRNDVQYTAGGCSLNTLRVFSWVFGQKNRSVFVGGIGKDERAEKLKSILNGCGVLLNFIHTNDQPTGSCVALVVGPERCLCADIGAAAFCRPEHIFTDDCLHFISPLNSASVIYLEGYFITHSFDVALKVAHHCASNGKTFVFNLCGSYVCQNHPKELEQLLPFVDILFGFAEEYRTLESFLNIPNLCEKNLGDKDNIVHDLNRMFHCLSDHSSPVKLNGMKLGAKRSNGNGDVQSHIPDECNDDILLFNEGKFILPWNAINNSKLVVVTQGSYPLLFTKDKQVYELDIPPVSPSKIVDTTGAGDSFVGGFLAAAAKGKQLISCLECGIWAAQQILKEKGCTIPNKKAVFL